MKHRPSISRAAGFTLLELLVAAALMAVLAVLCWRGLDSVIAGRDRLTEASDRLRELSSAINQLDDDFRRTWPVRLYATGQPSVAADGERDNPNLRLLVELPLAGGGTRLQRVQYRLRDGTLERGFAIWQPAAMTGAAPAQAVWQPLVSGLRSMDLRFFVERRGWVPWVQLAAGEAAPAAVLGAELRLVRLDGGLLVKAFSIKD